ncbi:hypothetical protein HRbin41_01480 [bacterium HR41]|nr:hypothetical protein HRbin41_01480 [bacterium HR41]
MRRVALVLGAAAVVERPVRGRAVRPFVFVRRDFVDREQCAPLDARERPDPPQLAPAPGYEHDEAALARVGDERDRHAWQDDRVVERD